MECHRYGDRLLKRTNSAKKKETEIKEEGNKLSPNDIGGQSYLATVHIEFHLYIIGK